jgi:hypothetical protein
MSLFTAPATPPPTRLVGTDHGQATEYIGLLPCVPPSPLCSEISQTTSLTFDVSHQHSYGWLDGDATCPFHYLKHDAKHEHDASPALLKHEIRLHLKRINSFVTRRP